MTDARVSVSRRIGASRADIFRVISSPSGHVDIDGSGMLMAPVDASPMTAVGDHFDMNMDREPLGDLPMGKYQVRNIVTKFEPDSVFEWNVGGVEQGPFGHVYGYELTEIGPGQTEVTLYCDWTGVRAGSIRDRFPIVPVHMLEKSLENLDRIVTDRGD